MTATLKPGAAAPGAASPIVQISGLDVGYRRYRKVQPAVAGLNLVGRGR